MTGTEPTERRQFSFTTRPYLAVDDTSGEPIGLDDIDSRVGWLLDLITGAETELLTRLWHPDTFDALAAGRDGDDPYCSPRGCGGGVGTRAGVVVVVSGLQRGTRPAEGVSRCMVSDLPTRWES